MPFDRAAYDQRPEVKERKAAYKKEYNQRPEVKEKNAAYRKEYNQRPEVKSKRKEAKKKYIQRIREEIWGVNPVRTEPQCPDPLLQM